MKPSQDDQKDILRNDSGSPLYREFVDSLGWPVDLKTHRGCVPVPAPLPLPLPLHLPVPVLCGG